jgi:hypothetical protein
MKATIEVPDELYRRVKSQSALLGRSVREVTVELYQRWLGDQPALGNPTATGSWTDRWVSLGAAVSGDVGQDGPTARELLAQDRGRLDDRDAGE